MKEQVSEGVISDIEHVYTARSWAVCRLKSETSLIHSTHYPSLFLRCFDIIGYKLYHTASTLNWVTGNTTLPTLTSKTKKSVRMAETKGRILCDKFARQQPPSHLSLLSPLFWHSSSVNTQLTEHLTQFQEHIFVLSAYISHSAVLRPFLCSIR